MESGKSQVQGQSLVRRFSSGRQGMKEEQTIDVNTSQKRTYRWQTNTWKMFKVREMQIKMIMWHHYMHTTIAVSSVDEILKKLQIYTLLVKVQRGTTALENTLLEPNEVKHTPPHPEIPLLGIWTSKSELTTKYVICVYENVTMKPISQCTTNIC